MEFQNKIQSQDELLNSAFVDENDLEFSLSDCYLESSESDKSMVRCAASFPNLLDFSPERFLYTKSDSSPIQFNFENSNDENTLALPDSCLLFTTSDNLESEVDQLTFVSKIDEYKKEKTETDVSIKMSCKNVYNYFANKIVKKLKCKSKKQTDKNQTEQEQEQEQEQDTKVIQLYTNPKTPIKFKSNKLYLPQAPLNSNSILMDNVMDNNFVNCGEFVTYFV